jgi:hypothetical protein
VMSGAPPVSPEDVAEYIPPPPGGASTGNGHSLLDELSFAPAPAPRGTVVTASMVEDMRRGMGAR